MKVNKLTNEELFKKLDDFSLDNPEASFSFSDRLSRENGWTKGFALQVIGEYKKFIYLSVVTGKSLTPSEEVDQAWHLHMIYTQSYWSEMCGDILKGLKLHHGPTKGGQSEKERYDNQYDYTLKVYKDEFGYDAPTNVWPNKEERFGNINFRRVSVRDNIILNKKKVRTYLTGFVIGICLTLTGFLLSSYKSESENVSGGDIFLWVLGIGFIIFLIRGLWRYGTRNDRNYNSKKDKNNDSNSSGGSSGDSGCSVAVAFFGCGSDSSSSGCSSGGSSGCGSSGCGSSGCGGCGGCGS
jgi:hypothetical protein